MSLPPPPGPKSSLQPPPPSLPPRPPQASGTQLSGFKPAYSAAPSYSSPAVPAGGYGANSQSATYNAFTAFQPRAVASSQPYRTSSPAVSGTTPTTPTAAYTGPTGYPTTYPQSQTSYQAGPTYYGQPTYGDGTYGSSAAAQTSGSYSSAGQGRGRDSGLDPETEAQIAQWQSAYMSREEKDAGQAKSAGRTGAGQSTSTTPGTSNAPTPGASTQQSVQKTVVRSGGGQTWTDPTLLEWDPSHFRLFVGNLAGEVTDESLRKAFSKYPSLQKTRVIRDKRTQKSKGYGFVSFSDGDDYFKAAREMQGKYIGSHPVLLRRATTEVRPVVVSNDKGKKGPNASGGNATSTTAATQKSKVKKQSKTKNGLKILG
ncbi:hypothetical protein VTN49DRAFT_25 [Thermomyces lanuginosus]|uniref:uncharacterized protein n=1 Tax=Thermomyces lanuginosus TaxID=5541 RepID=UPI0037449F89